MVLRLRGNDETARLKTCYDAIKIELQKNIDFFPIAFRIADIRICYVFQTFTFRRKKMPRKKSIDTKKLIKMIKEETPQPEIMKTFGFKTSVQLKNAYMNALIEQGSVPAIKSARKSGKASDNNAVNVGKRGSIIIPKEVVADMGYSENDAFAVRKTKAGISLKKI